MCQTHAQGCCNPAALADPHHGRWLYNGYMALTAEKSTPTMLAPASLERSPCMDDARAAASAIAEQVPGTERVCVYGSVARGDSHPGSDIDLVVIFDDIDYKEDRTRLATACWSAAGDVPYPVGLMITDRHEWAIRTAMATTIERSILSDIIELHASDNGQKLTSQPLVNKKMEIPVTDLDEAYRRVGEVSEAHWAVFEAITPGKSETKAATEASQSGKLLKLRKARYRKIMTECDMALELSLKCIHHALADTPPEREHSLKKLLDNLPDVPAKLQIKEHLSKLSVKNLPDEVYDKRDLQLEYTKWRIHGAYDMPSKAAKYLTADRANLYLDAVDEVSDVLLDVLAYESPGCALADTEDIALLVEHKNDIIKERRQYDLETGSPLTVRKNWMDRFWRMLRRGGGKATRQHTELRQRSVEPKATGSSICGAETLTGKRCRRLLGPDGRCPHHGQRR